MARKNCVVSLWQGWRNAVIDPDSGKREPLADEKKKEKHRKPEEKKEDRRKQAMNHDMHGTETPKYFGLWERIPNVSHDV